MAIFRTPSAPGAVSPGAPLSTDRVTGLALILAGMALVNLADVRQRPEG